MNDGDQLGRRRPTRVQAGAATAFLIVVLGCAAALAIAATFWLVTALLPST